MGWLSGLFGCEVGDVVAIRSGPERGHGGRVVAASTPTWFGGRHLVVRIPGLLGDRDVIVHENDTDH